MAIRYDYDGAAWLVCDKCGKAAHSATAGKSAARQVKNLRQEGWVAVKPAGHNCLDCKRTA